MKSVYTGSLLVFGEWMWQFNEYGEIMYDGRKDFQIKHMGYRIELGEIETAALGIEGVREACVQYDRNNKAIVLFYVGSADLDSVSLRNGLIRRIPKYMVPAVYRKVHRFRITTMARSTERF